MNWDRFDICEAYYAFATDYHGGQWSPEYAIFGRLHSIGFNPGMMGVSYDDLTDNGKYIYDNLVLQLEA